MSEINEGIVGEAVFDGESLLKVRAEANKNCNTEKQRKFGCDRRTPPPSP